MKDAARGLQPGGTGRVAFDDDVGLGVIVDADGGRWTGFHCTAIADGTRTIDVGVHVSYATRARHLGRWEATDIRVDPEEFSG